MFDFFSQKTTNHHSGNRLSHATQHLRSRGQTIFTALLYSISAAMVNNLAFQQLCISISLLKIKRNGLQVPLAAYQPSAVSLYWMTSGAMAVLLNLLLMEPRLISHDPSGQWLNHEPYYVKTAINDINPG